MGSPSISSRQKNRAGMEAYLQGKAEKMKNTLPVYGWILLFLGILLLGASDALAEEKPKLAILPFLVEQESFCPICRTVFQRGEILPNAQNSLTKLFYQKMEGKGVFRVLPLEKMEGTLSNRDMRIFQEKPKSSSVALAKELGCDFVTIGFVFRFEERIGSSVGVDRPASAEILCFCGVRDSSDSGQGWDGDMERQDG